jgi:hypothetical protein
MLVVQYWKKRKGMTKWKFLGDSENLFCCRIERSVKKLDEMLIELDQQVAEDLETPLDGIEEEYLLYNQMRFNWLSYRTAIQTHLSLFPESELDNKKPGKTLLKVWRLRRSSEFGMKMKRELGTDDDNDDEGSDEKKIKLETE